MHTDLSNNRDKKRDLRSDEIVQTIAIQNYDPNCFGCATTFGSLIYRYQRFPIGDHYHITLLRSANDRLDTLVFS